MIEEIEIEQIVSENIISDRSSQSIDNSIIDLSKSIKKEGLLHPVILKKISDNKYRVVCGQRRIAACKILGFKTIPSIIKEYPTITKEITSILSENTERKSYGLYEEFLLRCKVLYLMSLESDLIEIDEDIEYKMIEYIKLILNKSIASRITKKEDTALINFHKNCEHINCSPSHILRATFLLELEKDLLELVKEKKISLHIARNIKKISKEVYFDELMEFLKEYPSKITLSIIEGFIESKNNNKRKNKNEKMKIQFDKKKFIEIVDNIKDEKTLNYLQKVLENLEKKYNYKKENSNE